MESVSMCPASARSANEPVSSAPITSATMTVTVIVSAKASRRRYFCAAVIGTLWCVMRRPPVRDAPASNLPASNLPASGLPALKLAAPAPAARGTSSPLAGPTAATPDSPASSNSLDPGSARAVGRGLEGWPDARTSSIAPGRGPPLDHRPAVPPVRGCGGSADVRALTEHGTHPQPAGGRERNSREVASPYNDDIAHRRYRYRRTSRTEEREPHIIVRQCCGLMYRPRSTPCAARGEGLAAAE